VNSNNLTLDSWNELKEFISVNSSISINKKDWEIPEELKGKFYELFDAVRNNFVKEYCNSCLEEAKEFVRNYCQAEEEIKSLFQVESILLTKEQCNFIRDQADHFAWKVWDPLTNALQNHHSFHKFKERALRTVKLSALSNIRICYQNWIVLKLIKLMQPDEFYNVFARMEKPQ